MSYSLRVLVLYKCLQSIFHRCLSIDDKGECLDCPLDFDLALRVLIGLYIFSITTNSRWHL